AATLFRVATVSGATLSRRRVFPVRRLVSLKGCRRRDVIRGGCLHLVSSLPSISPGVFDAVDVSAAPSSPQELKEHRCL
ncbi:hypothetical protein LINPERPRIM_LOCUS8633, partial [Linum perenne]